MKPIAGFIVTVMTCATIGLGASMLNKTSPPPTVSLPVQAAETQPVKIPLQSLVVPNSTNEGTKYTNKTTKYTIDLDRWWNERAAAKTAEEASPSATPRHHHRRHFEDEPPRSQNCPPSVCLGDTK